MGLFKKHRRGLRHAKMILRAEGKFKDFYNFGMTIEEKKTDMVVIAASAIFYEEARNSKVTTGALYKIILELGDDSPFLQFAEKGLNRVSIAKVCEELYEHFLSEAISDRDAVSALYKAIKNCQLEKRNGVVIEKWHENGQEAVVANFDGGLRNGPYVEYYLSGAMKTKSTYVGGVLVGKKTSWDEGGTLKTLGYYKDGLKDGLWKEHIDGWPCEMTYLKGDLSPTGKRVRFYDNGQKESEIEFQNGMRSGMAIRWDRYGNKVEEGKYLDDEKHGAWIVLSEDGREKNRTYNHGELV